MRYDTVIIGGGLAGLTAGITLQEAGQRTAIVSAGQNALHFFSGTFESVGKDRDRTAGLFSRAGISLHDATGFRLMPTGTFKEADLSLADVTLFPDRHIADKVLIVNILGYHDFFASFLADALTRNGTDCRVRFLRFHEMDKLRLSPSEMRSVGIARILDEQWENAVADLRLLYKDEDLIILPQVFGLKDAAVAERIRESLPAPVAFVGTMPPSVPGIRTQDQLKRRFEALGGSFLMGDEVTSAALHDGVVSSVTTRNLGTCRLFADHFILATGAFFSKGLSSTPTQVLEPLFGLDVAYDGDRNTWYRKDFFQDQPYMGFGVRTDALLHAVKDGAHLRNLFVAGSVLGGTRPEFGTAAGLAIQSAFGAADQILNAKNAEA